MNLGFRRKTHDDIGEKLQEHEKEVEQQTVRLLKLEREKGIFKAPPRGLEVR